MIIVTGGAGFIGSAVCWGLNKKGIVRSLASNLQPSTSNLKVGDIIIEIDPRYFRPTEVEFLQADITKAKRKIKWEPRTTFDELIKIMVDHDMQISGLDPIGEGLKACENKRFTYTNHGFSFSSIRS